MASVNVHPARMRTTFVFVLTAIHSRAADSISQPIVIQCESSLSGMATVMNAIAIETCSIWITTVAGVGAVRGIVHFVGFDELVADRKLLEEGSELVAVVGGVGGGNCSDGEGAIAEGLVGGPGEVGGIGAAGEGDDEGREFGEIGEKLSLFLVTRWRRGFVETDLDDAAHGLRKV